MRWSLFFEGELEATELLLLGQSVTLCLPPYRSEENASISTHSGFWLAKELKSFSVQHIWVPLLKLDCSIYLWALQCSVDSQAWAKARQWLDVGGDGQWPPALSEDGEGERLEVLGVDVTILSTNWLKQVLAGDNLRGEKRLLETTLTLYNLSNSANTNANYHS